MNRWLGSEIKHSSLEDWYRSPARLSYLGRDATTLNDLGIARSQSEIADPEDP